MKVGYIDHMGTDLSVVNAARVSFNNESKELHDNDRKLIKYLADHEHWSPFAHPQISLRVKAPIFVARQLAKHQVGFAWNEVSRRYVSFKPEYYWPYKWRKKADDAKQGSSDEEYQSKDIALSEEHLKQLHSLYYQMILDGCSPEQARMVLPQATYTEWIWTGSLLAYGRMCKLRLDGHTQRETQEVAKMISDIIKPLFPVSWECLDILGDCMPTLIEVV
jgi:thymidylate synthase (FAD)